MERPLRGAGGAIYAQLEAYTRTYPVGEYVLSASPDPTVKDVHWSIGVEKGGSPGSVKLVAGIIKRVRPNWVSNTTLVAVCPSTKEKYEQLTGMLAEHVRQQRELVRDGVFVAGTRRVVRVFASGDYESLCAVHGHKGPNASMPCVWWYSTRAPSAAYVGMECKYGTLQNLDRVRTLRSAAHLGAMEAALSTNAGRALVPALPLHRSIERPPLIAIDPRQVVHFRCTSYWASRFDCSGWQLRL